MASTGLVSQCRCHRHRRDHHRREETSSTEAVAAVRRLEDAGIPVVLATGNVRPITYGLWRFLGLSAPMCCENGGVIWHPSWREPVLRATATEAREAALWLSERIDGLDPQGIATNRWRESEWCLHPDEPLNRSPRRWPVARGLT